MLSTKRMPQSRPDIKICLICGTNILLDHHMMDEHGLPIHTSCHEKQLLLNAAAQQTDLWRRNLSTRRSA
jgi:hypothetical protein